MISPILAPRRVQSALVLVTAVSGVALSGCVPSAAAIENVSPYKGQGGVAGDAPVTVTFDRAMDHASVESRVEVQPAISGCDSTSCPTSWGGNTFTLAHVAHPFNPDTKYRVFVHPGYRDSSGQANTVEHVWEFHTELALTLQSSTPAAGASGIATDADLGLHFSRAIPVPTAEQVTLRPTVSTTEAPLPYHLTLDPNDASVATVAPLRPLRPNTAYRLTVSDQTQDIHHNRLGKRIDIDFTTGGVDLSRSLGFAVLDSSGRATRIASLRPAASINAPAPSLRILYHAARPIASWAWSFDGSHLYTLESDGALRYISPGTDEATKLPVAASSFAASPSRDEIAYVATGGGLHIFTIGNGDIAVPQAGSLSAPPSWSGDGHRLAVVSGGAGNLGIIDRSTLSQFIVADVKAVTGAPIGWSFDGADMAFDRDVGSGKPHEVWIYHAVAAAGPLLQRVDTLTPAYLSWTPDGSTVYAGVAPGAADPKPLQRAPARVVAGQNGGFSPIRNSQPGDEAPVTPSFDRRVAFIRAAGGSPQMWLINSDGSGLTQLTFAGYDSDQQLVTFGVTMPHWAPGGPGG